jgi:glutathionyl-hydroquinone reductase
MLQVTACMDVSKVNVRDSDGKSVVTADRSPRVSYDYTVEMDRYRIYGSLEPWFDQTWKLNELERVD